MRSRDAGPLKTAASLSPAVARARARQHAPGAGPRRAPPGRRRHHALPPDRSAPARSGVADLDLAAADRSGARRHPRRAGQRRDRRHGNRRRDRGPPSGGRRGQRRLLPAAVRRSGRRLQDQRPTGERHETAARRGRDHPRRREDAAGLRPGHRNDDAPPAAARAGRYPHGDRGRGHHASSRQADALHPRVSRRTPTPPAAASSGSCAAIPCASPARRRPPGRRRFPAMASCCPTADRPRRHP